MTEVKARQNIQSIQLLRGLASLGVMLSHTAAFFLPKTNVFQLISEYGSLGVYVFFMISGFIIPYSMYQNDYKISDFKKLMLRRIIRIEPPYIICIILIVLMYYMNGFSPWYTGAKQIKPMDWWNVLGHIGYINAFTHRPWLNTVFWTLAIEFEYYILIGLVYPLVTSGNKKILLTANVLLLSTFYLTPLFFGGHHFFLYDAPIFYFLPFFLMGVSLFLWKTGKISVPELFILLALDGAVCVQNYGVFIFFICVLCLISIQFIKSVPKPFLFLGTISYSLYLTHSLVVTRFMALYAKVTSSTFTELRVFLCIVACLVVGYIYCVLFELPFMKLSKRVKLHSIKK